ncbi:hypothetical protein ABT160_32345 [Streptomyces sp. NPDC001941]|uniref:hypothetical protein n=1 Tax=Streptomyces sp. NPDC001941 TaxID=3154659 RepID=UPI00331CAF15
MGWYVLVERIRHGEWHLVDKVFVEGDRDAALVRGEEIARTLPMYLATASDPCGRQVFLTSPTSWFVELRGSSWAKGAKSPTEFTEHLTVRVAELVHVQELVPAEPTAKRRFGR